MPTCRLDYNESTYPTIPLSGRPRDTAGAAAGDDIPWPETEAEAEAQGGAADAAKADAPAVRWRPVGLGSADLLRVRAVVLDRWEPERDREEPGPDSSGLGPGPGRARGGTV